METEVRMIANEVAAEKSPDRLLVPIVAAANEFEGKQVTTIRYKGEPYWIAREIGRALEYEDGGKGLVDTIRIRWSDEMDEGTHYTVLSGQELKDFRALVEDGEHCSLSYAARLMLLSEKGLYYVCLKTNKPEGIRLRRFISDSVLPQLTRDGSYLPGREVVDGQLKLRDGAGSQSLVPLTQVQVSMAVREAVREEIAPIKETQRLIQADLTELKNRDGVEASTIGEQYGKQLRKRLVEIARQIAPHDKREQQRQRSLIDYTLRSTIGHHGVGARWEKLPTSKWPQALMELERIVRGSVGAARNQLPLFGELHVVQASSSGMR